MNFTIIAKDSGKTIQVKDRIANKITFDSFLGPGESAVVTVVAPVPTSPPMLVGDPNVPSPTPRNRVTTEVPTLPTARSAMPSRFQSPVVIERGSAPTE